MGKHLIYAGRLELVRLVLYGMIQFWLGIFPILGIVITQINSICKSFLWLGSIGNKSASIAWNFVYLPKSE